MRAPNLPTRSRSTVNMARTLVVLVCALLGLSLSTLAHAGFHVGGGPVDEIDGQGSYMVGVSWETEQAHPWEVIVGRIDGRDPDPTATPDVYFAAVSKRFTWRGFFVQGGVAMTNSDTEVLSEHWQFQTGLGYRYKHFTASIRHLSNANTGGRNRGENYLFLSYGF